MNRTIRAGITGALLLGGVAGLTVLGSPQTAERPWPAASDFATFTSNSPQGQIVITTDAGGKLSISYSGPLDLGELPRTVDLSPKKPDKCEVLRLGEAAHLVGVDVVSYEQVSPWVADPAQASVGRFFGTAVDEIGLVDSGLGSYNQLNCNQSNGRLEPGQGFRLTLGSAFPDGIDIDYAELDIEGKFGARLEAKTDAPAGANAYVKSLGNASDNNADSGSTDNDRITIGTSGTTDDFTMLQFAPASADRRGELALEGGGDFTEVPQATRLRTVLYLGQERVYEYTLVCNSNATTIYGPNIGVDADNNPTGLLEGSVQGIEEKLTDVDTDWTVDPDNGDYPSSVRVFRYQGKDSNGEDKDCDPIGADLEGQGGEDASGNPLPNTVLLEPSDNTAFMRVEITWVVPVPDGGLDASERFVRQIDIDGDEGPLDPTNAVYCTSSTATHEPILDPDTDELVDPFGPHNTGEVVHPLDTPWCVVSDTRELTETGEVIQTMVWDGLGDPKWY